MSGTGLSQPITEEMLEAEREFCERVIPFKEYSQCSNWYLKYLKLRFRSTWSSLFQPSLVGLDEAVESDAYKTSAVFRFLTKVADTLSKEEEVALVTVVDTLLNDGFLKDIDRVILTQLVFTAIGWLTLLYEPELSPEPQTL